jgi:glycosyl transferase, family 25
VNSLKTIPAFVINLTRDVSRWQNISAALSGFDVSYERVSAIDGRTRMNLVRRVIDRKFQFFSANRALTDGEICCSLSHLATLKRIVRRNIPMAAIFEDDVTFHDQFPIFFRNDLPHFLLSSDIVKFEGIHYSHTSKSGIAIATGATARLIVPLKPTLGSAAYAVTRNGALALIRALSAVDRPMDHNLAYYDHHWIAFAETRPLFARQVSYTSNIEAERASHFAPVPGARVPWWTWMWIKAGSTRRGALRFVYIGKFLVRRWFFRRGLPLAGQTEVAPCRQQEKQINVWSRGAD